MAAHAGSPKGGKTEYPKISCNLGGCPVLKAGMKPFVFGVAVLFVLMAAAFAWKTSRPNDLEPVSNKGIEENMVPSAEGKTPVVWRSFNQRVNDATRAGNEGNPAWTASSRSSFEKTASP